MGKEENPAAADKTMAELLWNLMEYIPESIYFKDKNNRFIMVNKTKAEHVGSTPEDIIGKTDFDFYPREIAENMAADDKRVMETGESIVDRVERLIRPSGEERWVSVTKAPLRDEKGVIIGTMGISRDITERKRAEEALREGERFLANIFASIQDGIGILDKDMNIVRVNPTMERWNARAMPLVGKKCYAAYHGRSERCEICPTWRTLQTGEAAYEVVPKHGPGGEIVGWLDLYSFPIIDTTTGQMRGVIEYVRDITERKRAEEALRESEQRYRALFENALDGVFVIDAETMRVVLANEAAANLFGFDSAEDVIGMDPLAFVPPDDRDRVIRIIVEDMFANDLRQVNEFRAITRDGREIWIRAVGARIKYQGKLAGLVSLCDITDRKRAEEERVRAGVAAARLEAERLAAEAAAKVTEAVRLTAEKYKAIIDELKQAQKKLTEESNLFQNFLDSIPTVIYLKDRDGRYLRVSKSYQMIHPESMIGKTAFDLYPEDQAKEATEGDKRVMETGKPIDEEGRFTTPDGSEHNVLITKAPLFDKKGNIVGIVGIVREKT